MAGQLGTVHMERALSPIAEAFGLGSPTAPLMAVGGGPSGVHRLWRLSTTRGHFAVKAVGQDPPANGDLEALEEPTRLELAAWAAGVPMPRPCLVPGTGAGVAVVGDPELASVPVRVHEWVDGHRARAPASQAVAAELGGALAALHNLNLRCGQDAQVDPWYRAAHGATHWRGLADRAAQAGRSWAERLGGALPLLAEVEALVAARAAEVVPLLMCHGDLVPGNVLVSTDGRPWILDWDDAGPWNPAEELAAALVSWSTGPQGEPCELVALALVQGYQRAGGVVNVESPTVLAGSLSAVANWLEVKVRRSLDGAAGGRVAQPAEAEVADALTELGWRMTWRHRWTELLLGPRPA
jgi:Ser/Thr protein kinase RdoA (MazF antagonist)